MGLKMTINSDQDLIESLEKQRQSVKRQLDAVTDGLTATSGSDRVRLEADRDNIVNQLREIDQKLNTSRQSIQAKNDEFQTLISILKTFSDDACSFMAAYQRALLNRPIAPELDDVESLVRHLMSDLDEPSPNKTLYRFVVYLGQLANQLKLPGSAVADLKQWARVNIPESELAVVKAEVKREQAEHLKQESCLLIKVYSSSVDEYYIKAWYISDRKNYRQNWPEGAKPVRLDGEADTTQTTLVDSSRADNPKEKLGNVLSCSAMEIKAMIQRVHQQCCDDHAAPVLVEIFLPKQLMNSDIDSWRLQEDKQRPLFGTRYPVILRSSDRLTPQYLCNLVQKKKWEAVERLLQTTAMPAFCEGDPSDINKLYVQAEKYSVPDKLDTKDVVGLKLTHPASVADEELEDLFEAILMDSALPIMIWARQSEVGLECSASINQILGCVLEQLPEELKSHRLEAFGNKQVCHIGNHLSLLWDDPHLIPPDSK